MLRITANGPAIAGPRPPAEMRGGAAAASFAQQLQGPPPGRAFVAAGGPAGLSAIGSLVALQEIRPPRPSRRTAVMRGEALLDDLAELQSALLADGAPAVTAERLRRRLAEDAGPNDEPALAALLDAIDLRARVELAKLERDGERSC